MKRSIIHIDGDSFFASCEISVDHTLRGKPVVTGKERGIATAMSKEAKALGVRRGMPVFQIKKEFPQVIIRSSDYGLYSIFADRMYNIVRRFTPYVEEYSIDECFADITHLERDHAVVARKIKDALQAELGMTFSLGLGPTKVLAKLASKKIKPDGFYVMGEENIESFLKDIEIGAVWGIGPSTSYDLQRRGIRTAYDFSIRHKDWVGEFCARPYVEIWHELRGESVLPVRSGEKDFSKSIQCTRTFNPTTTDKNFIFAELSKNTEGASVKMRRENLTTSHIYYFLKTQEFRYHRGEVKLDKPLTTPAEILQEVKKTFDTVYKPGTVYRATGITLSSLKPATLAQMSLFEPSDSPNGSNSWKDLYKTLDRIDKRYGSHTMVLGSSLEAYKRRGEVPSKRLRLPFIGYVE